MGNPGLLWVIRHGETAWSLSGQHTGRTDIPLTPNGEQQALALAPIIAGLSLARTWTSPLQRAARTAELACCSATHEPLAMEWDYGAYDGLTSAQIRESVPGWSVWREGPQGGETAEQVAARAQQIIDRHLALEGDTLLVSHGHFSRILAATWIGLPPQAGQYFALDTATLSCLGYEHGRRVLRLWNRR
ncbi:MAG: histidine phosphatase family protein [Bryobacter sp.]